MKAFGSLCLAFLCTLWSWCADSNMMFKSFFVKDGLPHNTVFNLLEDDLGFLWVATRGGLARYDGYSFETYFHNPEDPNTLSSNNTNNLLQDRDGIIWVGTWGGGLNRLDPETDEITSFKNEKNDAQTLSNNMIQCLYEDRAGYIWIGTYMGGLNRLDPRTGLVKRYPMGGTDHVQGVRIWCILEDEQGLMWLGTDKGLEIFDPKTEKSGYHRNSEHLPGVKSLFLDSEQRLWVGTGELTYWLPFDIHGDFSEPLEVRNVRSISEGIDGTIWFGTYDYGLALHDPKTGKTTFYEHDNDNSSSLSNNTIEHVVRGKSMHMWVGTRRGVVRATKRALTFNLMQHIPYHENSLSANNVSSIVENDQGDLYFATIYGGLSRLNRDTGLFQHYAHDPNDPDSISDQALMSLAFHKKHGLWIGTFNHGLNQFNEKTGKVRRFVNDPDDANSLCYDRVRVLFFDSSEQLWIGTDRGLNMLHMGTDKMSAWRSRENDIHGLSHPQVVTIIEDRDGMLWIGTEGGGLNRFNPKTNRFMAYRAEPGDPSRLSSDLVYCILEAEDGMYWIGTGSGGLNRFNKHSETFARYTHIRAVGTNSIIGIIEDKDGFLWMSSDMGLIRFNPRDETYTRFFVEDGLQDNGFNPGAWFAASWGELFFAGVNGVTSFYPNDFELNTFEPPVVFTDFKVFNRSVSYGKLVTRKPEVKLSYRDRVFSVEFAALDFTFPERNQYAYQLDGFSQEWIDLGNEHKVSFTNLDPGSYTLRVKASNNDGVWNEDAASMNIEITPPLWHTKTAYVGYGLLLFLGLMFYRWSYQRQLLLLEEKVSERTVELQHKTNELAKQHDELQDAYSQIEKASLTDALTGMKNRRYLSRFIEKDMAKVSRLYKDWQTGKKPYPENSDIVFVMVDLDHFKDVNDQYGHHAGDLVLMQMSHILANCTRESDVVIRWGGEEFLVVYRFTEGQVASQMAERLRQEVAQFRFDVTLDKPISLTCSIGYSCHPFIPKRAEAYSWEQMIKIADQALYSAKKTSRNAWVGIRSCDSYQILDLENRNLNELAAQGVVHIETSISSETALSWS